ncbi:hypothetical protein FA09DRAFT_346294 [Tilletiopsis washingtonensis]|uniref:Aromatic amino acid beta-eliminating lyase/threonine aldolase domain-containing protein n=1 Tax=Tilletiopsis washingtonensis TaxID=58919 RepID=A0A316Z8F9_9BASI|nr:hypothetical protein FA09DRAFT_346294 [Tilletiopsis washingtonensis]PWN97324.1 hypothetical protein FA09DRAFT_346294 [Tilletiopsis washingtonensis]
MTAALSAPRITASGPALLSAQTAGPRADNVAKLAAIARDLRSDTLTVPTDAMFAAMAEASRGDDVYLEDETTTSFEAELAALAGKEAALFVVSGTLSNQLAIRTHLLQPPYSILCDARSHIHRYEAGGAAFHSGAALETVAPQNGHHLTWAHDVQPNLVLGDDVHSAPTRLVSLENSLNGTILPQDEVLRIREGLDALDEDIKLHLDGARLWNVAAETGLSIKELCAPFDTVSMCLSKGLGAPVGTVLVGPSAFIRKARHFRKLFGAGIRQSGGLAAAARVAVVQHFPKLRATHELARFAAKGMQELGVEITSGAETSMFFYDPTPLGFDAATLAVRAAKLEPALHLASGPRIVVHHQTSAEAIDDLLALVAQLKDEFADRAGTHAKAVNGSLYSGMKKA